MTKWEMSPEKKRAMDLAAQVARMGDAERKALAERLPCVINPEGHALTPLNTILLYNQSQRADLTIVAGFRQWIGARRVVRKGEKSIGYIRVPMHVLPADARDKEGAPLPGREGERAIRFKFVAVFDVSQTEELTGAPQDAQGVGTDVGYLL